MSTNENVAPPVRVKLYEHQIAAYLKVLHLYDALGEAPRSGEVMPIIVSSGKGAALLMEMG